MYCIFFIHSSVDGYLEQKWKDNLQKGENICKQYNWQEVNLQNIQLKWDKDLDIHYSEEDTQMAKK